MRSRFITASICIALFASFAAGQDLFVDGFEDYVAEDELDMVWTYSKAGGPDGLFVYLNEFNSPPEGSRCLEMEIDMPEKWWYNIIRRPIPEAPLDLNQYTAVTFWVYGDPTMVEDSISLVCFLYDSQSRVLRFEVPYEYWGQAEWQKVTLSLDSFANEQWDAGYGTDTPDAVPSDIVEVGLMVVGEVDGVLGMIYVDDIRFVSATDTSVVRGTILEGESPMAGVTVRAIGQTSIAETETNASGGYEFSELSQGKPYRFVPVKDGYDFDPGLTSLTLLNPEYVVDFVGAPSVYDDLDNNIIADPIDETGLKPEIAYRGVAAWNNPGDDRPVIDVTQEKFYEVGFPDAEIVEAYLPPIEPNTLEGATSPRYAVEVGVSYSWDMLVFGQNTNKNYYAEVDVYCEIRDDLERGFDRISLGVRCNATDPDMPVLDALGATVPNWSSGGYALSYETDLGEIIARKYAPSNDTAHALNRLEGFAEDYASFPIADSGWYRFRIECAGETITFYVNGEQIAEVTDSDYPYGPAGLHYRACFPDSPTDLANMQHARFDNLSAGPTGPTAVRNWMLK